MDTPAVYVLGAVAVCTAIKLLRIGRRESYLPDGPPTVPILGNLHVFPPGAAHFQLSEWARKYGGIYSLKLGTKTAIVLTDATAVKDLMDKRSQSTADRPSNHVADLVTSGLYMALAGYTEDWRTLRRVSHEMLTPHACGQHLPIQRAESVQVLHDCLVEPKRFYTHLRRYSASVILSVLYGKRAPRFETQEVTDFFEMQHNWQGVLSPGAVPPIDFFPFLKYIPTPFASWKQRCFTARRLQRKIYFGLQGETEERIAQGYENGCFMEQMLARRAEFGMNREQVVYLAGVLIDGGSDTTSSWMQSLVLGMIAFPDALKKAHEELDRVVGRDRMPTPDDFPRLPYVQAVVKEVHRWRPVAPLAIPHATIDDITYRGFRIPAGSTIFVNNWGMFHDPDVYERAEDFWPDRWILGEFGTKPGVDDTDRRNNIWFGSGRRFCPGVHLANNSLMINTMNLLWAFDFGLATDPATGKEVPVDIYNYAKGIVSCPEPYQCTIKPRSAHHAEIIEHEFAAAESAFVEYEHGLREVDQAYVNAQRK
ncbi:hypothetical protein FS749_009926 [Ceratobasidium sp. UAMH 11750]|nr:hypothetical protein FS749_009926 [Ceratobasidium sp. UAMH 11750]